MVWPVRGMSWPCYCHDRRQMAKQQEDSDEDRATLEWPKANDEWSAQSDGSRRMKNAERAGLSIEPPEEQAMTCLWGCITAKKTT